MRLLYNAFPRLLFVVAAIGFPFGCHGERIANDPPQSAERPQGAAGGSPASPGGKGVAPSAAAQKSAKPASEGKSTLRPTVRIATSMGDITLELDAENTPGTVVNFLDYARDGFYNGTIFHRVVADRVIQAGGYDVDLNPKTTGVRPAIRNESGIGLSNLRGTIAMFRRPNEPNSAKTQFFINVADNAVLDRLRDSFGYAVFGRVIDGMDTVDKIRKTPVGPHPKYAAGRNAVVPQQPIVIRSIEVVTPFDREKATALAAQFRGEFERKLDKVVADLEEKSGNKVVLSDTGVRYVDFKVGGGASPVPTDSVELFFRGTLIDGSEFDTSEKDGNRTTKVVMSKLIKGLQEGLSTMREGGRRTIIVPSPMGYGSGGIPGKVPANTTIIYDIDLIEVGPEKIEPIRPNP